MIDRTCTNEKNQHTTFKKVAKNLNYNNNNRTVDSSKICYRNRLKANYFFVKWQSNYEYLWSTLRNISDKVIKLPQYSR